MQEKSIAKVKVEGKVVLILITYYDDWMYGYSSRLYSINSDTWSILKEYVLGLVVVAIIQAVSSSQSLLSLSRPKPLSSSSSPPLSSFYRLLSSSIIIISTITIMIIIILLLHPSSSSFLLCLASSSLLWLTRDR